MADQFGDLSISQILKGLANSFLTPTLDAPMFTWKFYLGPRCQWLTRGWFSVARKVAWRKLSKCALGPPPCAGTNTRPKVKSSGMVGVWGSWGWELYSRCWCVWSQPNGEHLGPVSASQRSSLSNCSASKLRLINCLAASGFKDPRCTIKLMVALSPLNLTPKQNLENIPDPNSPSHVSTLGRHGFFQMDFSTWACLVSVPICMYSCVHVCTSIIIGVCSD